MDYRALLGKYIDHVSLEEGTTFLVEWKRPPGRFTDEEWAELKRLERNDAPLTIGEAEAYRDPVGLRLTDEAIAAHKAELCRRPLLASSIGSICGRPRHHEGYCGDPIAATPEHPARRP